MNKKDVQNRIQAALKLFEQDSTTKDQFESIRTLVKGINPRIDNALETCLKALSNIEKMQQGEIIDLTAANLPEQTEEQKKRKKAILWFIKTWKDLKSEVERVRNELERNEQSSASDKSGRAAKIISGAKGPLGIITLVALVIVGATLFLTQGEKEPQKTSAPSNQSLPKTKVQVIEFQGKQIPLSELRVGIGPECDKAEHYHAKNGSTAVAVDKTTVVDPGGCGFGKVAEVAILEIEK